MSRQDALRHARECVSYARSLCDDIEFSPEDATRSDPDFLCEILQVVVDCGATTLNIPDTVGYTMPVEYGNLIRKIRETVKGDNLVISSHCHNDLECTINGIGERAGNCALEEVVMGIHVRNDVYPYICNVDRSQLYATSQMLSKTLGFNVQPNKAIVGLNAFAHEAGIHQHGVLSNPLCYEIMTPESVGMPLDRIVLGKHSGRHALLHRFKELGLDVANDELNELYAKFINLADRKKKIYDQDLISMVVTHRGPVSDSPNLATAKQ
jgi:2-isopropylmalate synthase